MILTFELEVLASQGMVSWSPYLFDLKTIQKAVFLKHSNLRTVIQISIKKKALDLPSICNNTPFLPLSQLQVRLYNGCVSQNCCEIGKHRTSIKSNKRSE